MRNLLLTLLLLLALPSLIYAQKDSTVNVRLENISLREAFQDIQDKSEYQFFYNDDITVLDQEVSLRLRKVNIQQVLDSLLLGTELSYQILEDKLIVIATSEGFKRHEVSGQVVDSENGETIPGAHVLIKGSTTGTITDIDGNFNILVPDGETILVFSFMGYAPVKIPSAGQTYIRVSLEESREKIEEVVITALNISREKSSLGYSLTQVSIEEFTQEKQSNPIN